MATESSSAPVDQWLADAKKMASEDPAKAAMLGVGVGVLLNVLPAYGILRTVSAVTSTLVRPALLTLGAMKVCELYLEHKASNPTRHD